MKLIRLVNNIRKQIVSLSCPAGTSYKSQLFRSVDDIPRKILNLGVNGLAINSKLVKEGDLFFCLKGTRCRGSDFINESYSNGATAVILDHAIEIKAPIIAIRVKDSIKALADTANEFYGHPSDKLNMTAITGTNGKTTITFAMENILRAFNKNAGVIGTVNYRFGNNVFPAFNTTPDIITINGLLKQMLGEKVKYLVMEVSSHALDQKRIDGLKFNQAIFTNLSQDHFDYHKTKNNYFSAKSILFTDYIKEGGTALINIDDAYGRRLRDLIRKNKKNKTKVITYGIENKADVSAKDIYFNRNGCRFKAEGLKSKFDVETNLIGTFNVYNVLASIAASLTLKIPREYIKEGLRSIYVPGRLEKVLCSYKDVSIFVDYAHTEDGLKNVLQSLNRLKGHGRLIVVFGCGGDRDKNKRPKMGKVASEIADFAIITSDNPRSENPWEIISDIKKGITKDNYIEVTDRKDAIEKAMGMIRSGDILVVAGKGHEDYQIIKDKRIAFNDRLIIEALLSRKG
jgi:UDP-N-acetylmuramoyl-L-alanyl-D-glutamate--2,6-diaminopimelate ligase